MKEVRKNEKMVLCCETTTASTIQ